MQISLFSFERVFWRSHFHVLRLHENSAASGRVDLDNNNAIAQAADAGWVSGATLHKTIKGYQTQVNTKHN